MDPDENSSDRSMTELVTGYTKDNVCFQLWSEVSNSEKARFFAQWKTYNAVMPNAIDRLKGEMWDANIVCKCIGHCDLNRFEDLNMLEQCRYEKTDQESMKMVLEPERTTQPIRHKCRREEQQPVDDSARPSEESTEESSAEGSEAARFAQRYMPDFSNLDHSIFD